MAIRRTTSTRPAPRAVRAAPALATVPKAAPAPATPPRKPEPVGVVKARNAVNAAANEFETARAAYAAAGDRLNAAQAALTAALEAAK